MSVPVAGFDHVDLFVTDLPKATEFFERRMGFEVMGAAEDHTFLLVGDQVLGLRRVPPGGAPSSLHHLAIRVEDLERTEQALRARSLPIVDSKKREDSSSVYVTGPEDLVIEFVHRPRPDTHPCHEPRAHS